MAATDPLLRIHVASPCTMSWNAMEGSDRTRYCSKCELTVYNLSGMTRGEAEALIRAREGRLCVRLFRRADGTVLTRDCPSGFRAARRRVLAIAASGVAALVTVAGWATMAAPGMRRREPFSSWIRWLDRSSQSVDDLDGEYALGDSGDADETEPGDDGPEWVEEAPEEESREG